MRRTIGEANLDQHKYLAIRALRKYAEEATGASLSAATAAKAHDELKSNIVRTPVQGLLQDRVCVGELLGEGWSRGRMPPFTKECFVVAIMGGK